MRERTSLLFKSDRISECLNDYLRDCGSLLEHMKRVSNKGQRADGISSDQFLLWSVWLRQKKEWAKIPTIKKKTVSITRRVTMRACLERPILPKAKGGE